MTCPVSIEFVTASFVNILVVVVVAVVVVVVVVVGGGGGGGGGGGDGWLVECCFTSSETISLLGTKAQYVHLDFHTTPEL